MTTQPPTHRDTLLHLANEILKCKQWHEARGMRTNVTPPLTFSQANYLLREIRNQVEELEGCTLEEACDQWNEATYG